MPAENTAANSPKDKSRLFLAEHLRIIDNYIVVPLIIIVWLLLRVGFAFLGDYLDLAMKELPISGMLFGALAYLFVSVRHTLNDAKGLFGLDSREDSPLAELFEDGFEDYHKKTKSRIFKREIAFGVVLAIVWLISTSYSDMFIRKAFGKPYGPAQSESTIALIDYIVTIDLLGFFAVSIFGSILWAIIGMLWSIYALGQAEGLKLNVYMNPRKMSPETEYTSSEISELGSTTFSYEQLHRKVQRIGSFCFNVSFRLMVTALLGGGWVAVAAWTFGVNLVRVIFLLIIVLLSLLFFIIPQVSLHQSLKTSKIVVLDQVKDVYEAAKNAYLQTTVVPTTLTSEEDPRLTNDFDWMVRRIEILNIMVSDLEAISTWPYEPSQLRKLLGSGVLPFIIPLLSALVKPILEQ